ncbi:MAG: TspO/MBR family protein [Sphingomonadaceae bacterium]
MSELASASQLRMAYVRWALVTVPAIVFLGFLSGQLSNSGFGNPWFDALVKPAIMPPGWLFGAAWAVLYALQGLALALILNARGNRFRSYAIALFAVQFIVNLLWSPLFFAAHQVLAAFVLICVMLGLAIATTVAFARVRTLAAWMMVPYLLWLSFASILNWQLHALNPGAEALVIAPQGTQIDLE